MAKATTRSIIEEVVVERGRQRIWEGFDHTHDDAHAHGELAKAAACYAASAAGVSRISELGGQTDLWPFEKDWDKRVAHDPRRELIIAAALIVAEVERLERRSEGDELSASDHGPRSA